MKREHITQPVSRFVGKLIALSAMGLMASAASVGAQSIFVDLLTDSSGIGTTSIAAPTGYSYSGAAPVAGTMWNTLGEANILSGLSPGTYSMYSGLSLVDASGASITPTLSISYYNDHENPMSKDQPSGGSGENTIQPGGVMQDAWRNYYNGHGNYFTFTISGLTASTPFDLYFMGGTKYSGQNVGIQLAAGNVLGANPDNGVTLNTTANSDGNYGSLWTSAGGGNYKLMTEGQTWEVLHGQSDASGYFSFDFKTITDNSQAYMTGFQLVQMVPEPGFLAFAALGMLGMIWQFRRVRS